MVPRSSGGCLLYVQDIVQVSAKHGDDDALLSWQCESWALMASGLYVQLGMLARTARGKGLIIRDSSGSRRGAVLIHTVHYVSSRQGERITSLASLACFASGAR